MARSNFCHNLTRNCHNLTRIFTPGAAYIIRDDQRRIDLRHIHSKNDLNLSIGWTVERHLRDEVTQTLTRTDTILNPKLSQFNPRL